MSSIKTLTAALVAAGAIAAPAASADAGLGPDRVRPQPSPMVVQAPAADNGFDWGDAGMGASSAIAVALLALGGVATLRHRSMSPGS